jgi:hypothetical protein
VQDCEAGTQVLKSAKLLQIYAIIILDTLNPEFNHHPLGNITRMRSPSKFSSTPAWPEVLETQPEQAKQDG